VLGADEFTTLFEGHREQLAIKQANKVFIVSSKEGGACPHWGPDGCRVYEQRPVDCRVFPYITALVIESRSRVKIVFHSRSDCPLKEQLYPDMPEADIKRLLTEWGKSMYGSTKAIVVCYEQGFFSRLQHRIEAAISRRLYRT
jgi:Fe-S-cluster containining protein